MNILTFFLFAPKLKQVGFLLKSLQLFLWLWIFMSRYLCPHIWILGPTEGGTPGRVFLTVGWQMFNSWAHTLFQQQAWHTVGTWGIAGPLTPAWPCPFSTSSPSLDAGITTLKEGSPQLHGGHTPIHRPWCSKELRAAEKWEQELLAWRLCGVECWRKRNAGNVGRASMVIRAEKYSEARCGVYGGLAGGVFLVEATWQGGRKFGRPQIKNRFRVEVWDCFHGPERLPDGGISWIHTCLYFKETEVELNPIYCMKREDITSLPE